MRQSLRPVLPMWKADKSVIPRLQQTSQGQQVPLSNSAKAATTVEKWGTSPVNAIPLVWTEAEATHEEVDPAPRNPIGRRRVSGDTVGAVKGDAAGHRKRRRRGRIDHGIDRRREKTDIQEATHPTPEGKSDANMESI